MKIKAEINTNVEPNQLAWGLQDIPQGDYLAAWGARAIFEDGTVYFLPDRQDSLGEYDAREILGEWVIKEALDKLNNEIKSHHWNGSTEETFRYESHNCTLYASPRKSYGYMYLTAVLEGKKEIPEGRWSGKSPVPPIGSTVSAKINGIGRCKVIGYGIEANWIYVLCKLLDPPDWYVKQHGKHALCGLFGAEIG